MKEFFNIRRDRANRTRTQIITIVVCLMLAMAIAIGGTVAWLIDKTDSVTDTFTYGKIDIALTEGNTNPAKLWIEAQNGASATDTTFKLVPGAPYTFNPYVYVEAKNEPCYLFIEIEETNKFNTFFTSADYAIHSAWNPLTDHPGVYYQKISSLTASTYYPIITNDRLKVAPGLDSETLNNIGDNYPTIKITAYAIQSDYLNDANNATANDAWDALNNQLSNS